MKLGTKGQATAIALAAAVLVTMVVGIGITDDITCKFCQCEEATPLNKTLVFNVWNNESCEGEKCDNEDWGVICNSTTLVPGNEYNINDCDVQLTNATWNNTNCQLDYNYEGSYYHGTDVVALIMCNIPILMGTAGLALAGAWLFLKGGL